MTTTKKDSETGWFYHAPRKVPASDSPVGAPPASQIPGLGDLSDKPVEEDRRNWIKESDSKYVILAKQGGRPDLLRYRSPKPKAEGPQGYPRCEWYYHTDVLNQESNDQAPEPYDFTLPDYMVHSQWTGGDNSPGSPNKRAPFSYDENTVFTRENSNNPTDKTVKLPEIRPAGYGVRAEKQHGRTQKHAPVNRVQPIRPHAELDEGKMKYEPLPQSSEGDRAVMGKLLSHGYVGDWEDSREKWYGKQRRNEEKHNAQSHTHKEKIQTEYQENMKSVNSPQARGNPVAGVASRRGESGKGTPNSRSKPVVTEQDRELFKLSKFKNVSAKTDSRRPNCRHASRGSNPITHNLDPIDNRTDQYQPTVAPVAY